MLGKAEYALTHTIKMSLAFSNVPIFPKLDASSNSTSLAESGSELRSCVKVEVDVLGVLDVPNKPTVSVDVKQHFNQHQQTADYSVYIGLLMQCTKIKLLPLYTPSSQAPS